MSSKTPDGKASHVQVVLGLVVSKEEVFDGVKRGGVGGGFREQGGSSGGEGRYLPSLREREGRQGGEDRGGLLLYSRRVGGGV